MARNFMKYQEFATQRSAAKAVSMVIAQTISTAIATKGQALLALSGGTTPKTVYHELSQISLAWDKVIITLSDERWSPLQPARRNDRFLWENLCARTKPTPRLLPMYCDFVRNLEAALQNFDAQFRQIGTNLDLILLGMGGDGHIASLFPQGDHLAAGLNPDGQEIALPMHAPGAGEPRMTLTLATILAAKRVLLLFHGPKKARVFARAKESVEQELGEKGAGQEKIARQSNIPPLPIKALLAQKKTCIEVFYASE